LSVGGYVVKYQINNLMTQTSREVVTALSTENGPLKVVKQEWPKHVGGFNDVIYKHF
jgi:hypothetical protein